MVFRLLWIGEWRESWKMVDCCIRIIYCNILFGGLMNGFFYCVLILLFNVIIVGDICYYFEFMGLVWF